MHSTGLSESFVRSYVNKRVPWGPVGYVTYKRTYARLIPELGRTEEWYETCARVCNGLVELGALYTDSELEQLYDTLFHLKGSVSGRALWQLGTENVQQIGADSLVNCWNVPLNSLESFCFLFNQLMLGGGVGCNIEPKYVYELPPVTYEPLIQRVDSPDCTFIVPDNREGWVELLRRVLQAFFVDGKPLIYSTQCIRAAGRPIYSFGGKASGSEPLVTGIGQIIEVLSGRVGEKLRPIDCMDVANIIGTIVVSGNVRRSSEIMLGSPHDLEFLRAKNWNTGTVPNWRAMSNNSVVCDDIGNLLSEFWTPYETNGECYGLVNINNCRRFGRLIDGADYRPDYDITGVNPCGEIGLASMEPCNLAEVFLPRINDLEEGKRVTSLLYRACKTIANHHYSDPCTEATVHANNRIGISLTGYMAAPRWARTFPALNALYRNLECVDDWYSKKLGVPPCIKLTTIKPSGTLSLLPPGVTPGMHAAYGRYLIRRIRFSANDPIVETCLQNGYLVEPLLNFDGSVDHRTAVVEFPMDYGKGVITEADVSVVDQLNTMKFLQTYWSDNSISCTHYFSPDELSDVRDWLRQNYNDSVKSASFMHRTDHGFKQAPLERITQEQYEKLVARTKPIDKLTDSQELTMADNLECAGGSCPVR